MVHMVLLYRSNICLDRDALLTWTAGDRRGHALDATFRELGEPGGDNAERRSGVPRQAHHDASLALPASAPGEFRSLSRDSSSADMSVFRPVLRTRTRYEGDGAVSDPVYVRGEPELVRRAARHCHHGLPVAAL